MARRTVLHATPASLVCLFLRCARLQPSHRPTTLMTCARVLAQHFRPLRLVFSAMAVTARFTFPLRLCAGQPAARRSAAAPPRLALPLRVAPLVCVKQKRVARASTRSASRVAVRCVATGEGALPKGASSSMELDAASLVRYVAATALQLGVIVLVMAGLDAVVLPRLSPVAQRWFVGGWFLFNVRAMRCSCSRCRLLALTHAAPMSPPAVAALTHILAARCKAPVARL